jgi:hypothetical protein
MAAIIILLFIALLFLWGVVDSWLQRKPPNEEKLNKWYMNAPYHVMEKVTRIYRGRFSPDNNYEEFIEACDIEWFHMTYEQKLDAFRLINLPYNNYYSNGKKVNHTRSTSYRNSDCFGSE